ncbi:hypothetical protein [Streptomyces sp. MST-110588]|uniref:hypothetical protein n=1 Tax=Streptomyces sp. MST-110588 TaxID=2833628 RepID=UPI001F5D49BC|nr:hypothetical protein [Streptomyces sp. MST-110588]UNO43363.1 hypothetical protein KGS77_32610 [Streptomyces sp. MST-110588]
MTTRRTPTVLSALTAAVGAGVGLAAPASAGGVADLLSPAFGTLCANRHTGAHADGFTRQGTGTADGNLAGVPIGSALNQCGGADAPAVVQDGAEDSLGFLQDSVKGLEIPTKLSGAQVVPLAARGLNGIGSG